MIRSLGPLLVGLMIMLSLPTTSRAAELDVRLGAVAAAAHTHVAFEEIRHSDLLSGPQRYVGALSYDPASGAMTKRIEAPEAVVLTVDQRRVRIQRDGRTRRFSLRSRPELTVLLSGFRALLEGDIKTLRAHFAVDYSEQGNDHWQMHLSPSNERVATQVEVVIVSGVGDRVMSIRTQMHNGDWQDLRLLHELADPAASQALR